MEQQKNGIFSKWLIQGFPDLVFGSDKNLYKLPFESHHKWKSLRMLKKQHPNRYKISGKWWSEKQLQSRIYLNPNPELIIKRQEMPF